MTERLPSASSWRADAPSLARQRTPTPGTRAQGTESPWHSDIAAPPEPVCLLSAATTVLWPCRADQPAGADGTKSSWRVIIDPKVRLEAFTEISSLEAAHENAKTCSF